MATFVAIVDNGSLSAAAERIDRSPASVVRALAELENRLGVRLLNRSTRSLNLTDEGREYLLHCRRILADVEAADLSLADRRAEPTGKLTLTAPVMFGRMHVSPVLNDWLAGHPNMTAELMLLDRVVDIIEEGFDLAIRIGHLADSSLIARPLGFNRTVVCAHPRLVERLGDPRQPADLASWPAVVFASHSRQWQFQFNGRQVVQTVSPVITTNQIDAVLAAAVSGLGVARLFAYQAEQAIRDGHLQRLLIDYEPPPRPVQFIYPHNRLLSPRVRAFLDWSTPRLRQLLSALDDSLAVADR